MQNVERLVCLLENGRNVMTYEEVFSKYEEKLQNEYQEAKLNGFKGTKEEYLKSRDHT